MAVTQNLKGTSYPSFKIHKSGPTLYQGSVSPSVGNPASPRNGDLYMQHGTSGRLWIYGSGSWSEIETGLNDALDSFTLRSTYVPEAKNIQYILTGTSTDANEIELLIQTTLSADTTLIDVTNTTIDGSTTITSGRINIPDDTAGIVEAKIVARDSDNNENAGYIIKGVVVNDSGSTVLLTDPMEEILGESTTSWYALIEANDTTDSVVVKASGSANATIKWTAFVNVTLAYSTPQYSLSSNTNSVSEGQSVTYTLTTRSITDGTTVPYTITGIDQADLSAGNLTGNFTVTNNTATLTFTLVEDATTEGTENMTLALDNGLASANVVVVSDTSLTPTYSLSADNTTINEGDTVTFTLTTTNVADGTNIAYTVTGIDANDLSAGSLTGNITVNSNTGTAAFTLAEDTSTEGQEVMTLTLDNGGDALDVVITDSSTAPAGTPSPIVEHTIANPNPYGTPANDWFAYSTAINNTHIIAGAPSEDEANSASPGKAYIFDATTDNLLYTLDNPNTYSRSDYDSFGDAVGISDSYAIVGAPRDEVYVEEFGYAQYKPGVAYIYNLSDGSLKNTLLNPLAYDSDNLSNDQRFGDAVAINETYALVGAPETRYNNQGGAGRAYVYNTSNGSLAYTLNNPNIAAAIFFGWSVSMSDNYAIISSRGSGGDGRAYVYDIANNFSLLYTLENPNPDTNDSNDYFGEGVAITNTHAIVAAPYEDSNGNTDIGKAYIFDLSDGSLLHTLSHPGTSNYFSYGGAVAIDDNYAFVGAIYEDGNNSQEGKVYIFDLSDGSLVSTISSPSGQASARFGHTLATAGNKLAVGNYAYDDSNGNVDAGILYIFDLNISSSGGGSGNNSIDFSNATLAFTLDNPNVFSSAGDRFSNGNSVDMSGNYAIIGAYYEDTASTSQTGVAYIFDVTTGNLVHTLNNPSGTTAYFGGSVSISGNHAIVGGPFTSAAYIFDVTTGNLVHTISQVAGSTYFGQAVAISDNYAIVGARETDDSNGVDSGTAYIYDVTTGALLHTLNNPNEFGTVVKDNFGFSVAISDSYAVVGAKDEDDASGNDKSGVVYVFDVTTGNLVYTLINPGHPSGNGNNYFGHVVDLTDTHLLVSAYGAARVYLYSLSDGSLLHTIDNPNENTISSADFFGISAAIDGDHIVVGAIGEDTAEYNSVGVAYIFDVNTGSSVKTLYNPNAYDIPSDNFGDSVAISGEYIVVGSREDDETGNNSGKAYIFAGASGSGALSSGWVRTTSPIQGTLQSSTPIPRLFAVSVGDDGTIFAGGADVSGNKTTYAIAYDTDGGLAWGRRAGGNNSSYQDEFQDVATTGNDAIMVGNGYGHATYGPGIITKFQADGTTSWQKILYDTTNTSGSPNDDWWDTRGVVVGSDGSIYVCGQTRIGGLSYSENGLFITKLASDGTHTWTRVLEGGTGQEQQGGYKIAVDSNDNVFVCGTAHEDVSGNGYVSAFVAKLTSAGSMQWYRIYNDDGDTLGRHSEYATHIKVNSSDEIILSGFTNTDYVGQNYPFVAKLANSDGNIIWQRRSNHTDPGQGIALDNSDNIYQVCNNYQLNIWDNSGSLIGEWEFTSGNGSFYTRGITKDHNGNMIIVGHSFIGSTAGAIVIKLPATISAGTWGDFTIAATSKGDTAGALILDNHTSISNYTPSNITTSDANSNLTQGSVTITGGISETL